jgi:hypothetical protein
MTTGNRSLHEGHLSTMNLAFVKLSLIKLKVDENKQFIPSEAKEDKFTKLVVSELDFKAVHNYFQSSALVYLLSPDGDCNLDETNLKEYVELAKTDFSDLSLKRVGLGDGNFDLSSRTLRFFVVVDDCNGSKALSNRTSNVSGDTALVGEKRKRKPPQFASDIRHNLQNVIHSCLSKDPETGKIYTEKDGHGKHYKAGAYEAVGLAVKAFEDAGIVMAPQKAHGILGE